MILSHRELFGGLMRAIRILFYLGLLSFLSLMGLWFYSCERIASLLPQGPFEYELGALGKVKGSVHIEDVSYLGLLDGQAGVRFKLRKVEANFEGAHGQFMKILKNF